MDGKVITELGSEYQVELAGNRTAWASPPNLRPGMPAAPVAAPKTGVPPKPGLVSCAGKIEGRYATTGNFGAFTITFRSGKATMTDVATMRSSNAGRGAKRSTCTSPMAPNLEMPIDINLDGTLQTPLGEIKKKGN